MSSSESDINDVRAHEWKPSESSTCAGDVENTNDKTKQVGMKLVQSDKDKPSPVKKPKKTSRVSEKWARTERKKKRNLGLAYIEVTGEMVGERKLGSNCACQSECMDAIGEEECAKICSSFWALGYYSVQNAYLAGFFISVMCRVSCVLYVI